MDRVNIYVMTSDQGMKSAERQAGYVMEFQKKDGELVTREHFCWVNSTYNGATLKMMADAAGKLVRPCEVHFYIPNTYIADMMENYLEDWARRGFRKKSGEPIANQKEWKKLWECRKEHLFTAEGGTHQYAAWMMLTMEERRDKHCG